MYVWRLGTSRFQRRLTARRVVTMRYLSKMHLTGSRGEPEKDADAALWAARRYGACLQGRRSGVDPRTQVRQGWRRFDAPRGAGSGRRGTGPNWQRWPG